MQYYVNAGCYRSIKSAKFVQKALSDSGFYFTITRLTGPVNRYSLDSTIIDRYSIASNLTKELKETGYSVRLCEYGMAR